MREPDGRQRQFVVKSKRESEYDEPAVRRRALRDEDEEPRRRRSFADDEAEGKAKPGFFARRSLREREEEEAEEVRRSQRQRRRGYEYEDDEDAEEEEDEQRKAPKVVRIFSWLALLVILFAIGYLGANYFFNWADKRGGPRVGEVYGSGSEVAQSSSDANSGAQTPAASAAYTLYIPQNGKLDKRGIDISKGLVEEDIEKVASMYFDSMKETNAIDGGVRVLNVFQSGDWLYLDMTDAFQSSIKKLGKDKGTEVIGGLVRTMTENFPPVKKVKFYIGGKESKMKTPVDLTQPWEGK